MKGIFENNDLNIVIKDVDGFRGFVPMFHSHMEIVYVRSGKIQMNIDGVNHILESGEMSLCFPYVIHSYAQSPEAKAVILLFSTAAAGAMERDLLQNKPVMPFVKATKEMCMLLEQILAHSAEAGALQELTAQAFLSALAGHLLTTLPMTPVEAVDTDTVQDLLVYCAAHYRENITIDTVSRALHISPGYISRIFSEKLNCPFRTYLNRLRIADAKQLLKNTGRTVLDIMLECGFSNQSSFNRIFVQEVGCTPREYRKSE